MDPKYSSSHKHPIDEISLRLNEMNVVDIDNCAINRRFQNSNSQLLSSWSSQEHLNLSNSLGDDDDEDMVRQDYNINILEDIFDNDENMSQNLDLSQRVDNSKQNIDNKTLIVTNVDYNVFADIGLRNKFENLFRVFDQNIEFRYLKSFRRVRLDFSSINTAAAALKELRQYKLGDTIFKSYMVQFIKSESMSTKHLMLPKLTRQFLISPPASPPENWKPITEHPPVIDIQLISAIANLVPGQVHELHPASDTHPGIFVHVCGDAKYTNENDVQMDDRNYEYEVLDEDDDDDMLTYRSSKHGSKVRIPPTPRPI